METRADPLDKKEIVTQDSNFSNKSQEPSCTQRLTAKKQSYRLCHWMTGDVSSYEIRFIKHETYVRSLLPGSLEKPYSLEELDTYVDSFKRSEPKKNVEIKNNTI